MSESEKNGATPAGSAREAARPPMPAARRSLLDRVIENTTQFDAEAWHVMERRDNRLIEDELLNGSGSSAFVYSFPLQGKEVSGISVIGARHIASSYGGLKHRFITSTSKIGAMLQHKSYPGEHGHGGLKIEYHPSLEDEEDYYECVVEITDIKTGVSIQVEKRETRLERKRDGSFFERPHYQIIAQSKAFRNGILAVIPQDVQIKWKTQQLALGKNVQITASVLEEKRQVLIGVLTKNGIPFDRDTIDELTLDQLSAWQAGNTGVAAFTQIGIALGVIKAPETAAPAADKAKATTKAGTPAKAPKGAEGAHPKSAGPDVNAQPDFGGDPRPEPQHDPETGEIEAGKDAAAKATPAAASASNPPKTLF